MYRTVHAVSCGGVGGGVDTGINPPALLQVVLDKNVCEEGVLEEAEFYNITGPLFFIFVNYTNRSQE
jgi:hypothetical protein